MAFNIECHMAFIDQLEIGRFLVWFELHKVWNPNTRTSMPRRKPKLFRSTASKAPVEILY